MNQIAFDLNDAVGHRLLLKENKLMNNYPGGVWPVMLTPFTRDGQVDEAGLRALVDWYIASGVDGLFASCQSSEIFNMDEKERMDIARITVEQAAGRVPVVASGFTPYDLDEQVASIEKMHATRVDAVILLTNRLAGEGESDEVLMARVDALLSRISPEIRLGLYECPMPYKRLLSIPVIEHCAQTGRFYFLKDTCCDRAQIKEKLAATKGTSLKLYNANTTTLLTSMLDGAPGYSGIMANFHPEVYVWLTRNIHHENAPMVQDLMTLSSLIERQCYPVSAKFHLREIEKLPIQTTCRVRDDALLTDTFKTEVRQMDEVMNDTYRRLCQ
ncbi:MAG: dihydrodipicolinate synthase family protein [Clostridia bacterium]